MFQVTNQVTCNTKSNNKASIKFKVHVEKFMRLHLVHLRQMHFTPVKCSVHLSSQAKISNSSLSSASNDSDSTRTSVGHSTRICSRLVNFNNDLKHFSTSHKSNQVDVNQSLRSNKSNHHVINQIKS